MILESDEEQRCLVEHNKYRLAHGKKALKWNSKIADSARQWAEKQSKNGAGNMVSSIGTGYGENMKFARDVTPGTEGREAVQRWYVRF